MRRALIVGLAVLLACCGVASAARHHHPVAHTAHCGGNCKLAEAYPGWVCDIQGAVVAAGVAIVTDGAGIAEAAKTVWSILSGGAWTAGCHIIDNYMITSTAAAKLRDTGVNCFYEWSHKHKHRKIRCQSYYA